MNLKTEKKIRFIIVTMICLVIYSVGVIPVMVSASDFDVSEPLTCASIQLYECLNNNGCIATTPEVVNLPQFLKINFKDQVISANMESGRKETSKIKNTEQLEDRLVLSGSEDGLGWNITISKKSGKFVLTASGDQVGFVVFGACTQQ